MADPFPIEHRPSGIDFRLVANSQVFQSPLNRATQTLELPGQLWQFTLTYTRYPIEDAQDLQAWLESLNGRAGRFELWDHRRERPRGAYSAGDDSPQVDGAGQTGNALATDGWRADQTGLLVRGDYVEVAAGGQKRLLRVTAPVDSDGTGAATIPFVPALTIAPDDEAALNLIRASALFMLASDDEAGAPLTGNVASLAFSGVEEF